VLAGSYAVFFMDIVPGQHIEDFKIGDQLSRHRLFNKLKKKSEDKYECDHITVRTNSQGQIDLVATTIGDYNGIVPGKTFRHVIESGHTLLYDEFDQVFYLKSPDGLCIGKKYENMEFAKLLDSQIEYLNIFNINSEKEVRQTIWKDFQELDRNSLVGLKNK
jgi:hypothetical protein